MTDSNQNVGQKENFAKEINPLAIIQHERADQRRLCENLELIADHLPKFSNQSPVSIYDTLRNRLPVYHRNEEAMYLLLSHRCMKTLDLNMIIERITEEHNIHDCYADEFLAFLQDCESGADISVFGYMFRYIFETIDRHLSWEEIVLMPLVEEYLTLSDKRELAKIITNNRKQFGPTSV